MMFWTIWMACILKSTSALTLRYIRFSKTSLYPPYSSPRHDHDCSSHRNGLWKQSRKGKIVLDITKVQSQIGSSENDSFDFFDNDDDDEDIDEDDFKPVDFRIFLTQRSIQSFLFLLSDLRDPHTIKWLDNFLQPYLYISKPTITDSDTDRDTDRDIKDVVSRLNNDLGYTTSVANDKTLSSNLLHYHGISALNTTEVQSWDDIFFALVEEPSSTLYIESNNPILKEFEIDIDPNKLCSRILSVRDQISKEWIKDLEVISSIGSEIFYSYWENVDRKDGVAFERPSQIFLELNPDTESDLKPSPLRKASYDLLLRLSTQVSICRVLQREDGITIDDNDEDHARKSKANQKFLKEFYIERLYQCFKGNIGTYGKADDFLEELMLSPPRMVLVGGDNDDNDDSMNSMNNNGALLVDPLGIAEAVLRERDRVALEWRELIMETITKGTDQVDLRKRMLNRMMGITTTESKDDT